MIARRPDWQPRLAAWLAAVRDRPFADGQHDCALFWAGAVEAMTGHDPAAAFRGRYTTRRGGLRLLRRAGHTDQMDLAAALFRRRERGERARPGDLAALPMPEGHAGGVVQSAAVYVPGPNGLALVPLPADAIVFEVP